MFAKPPHLHNKVSGNKMSHRADWFSRWFLEVDVMKGVTMFILLNRILFAFSFFSHSDSFVDICNDFIA